MISKDNERQKPIKYYRNISKHTGDMPFTFSIQNLVQGG